jgi:PAS domain S-box-containing protein
MPNKNGIEMIKDISDIDTDIPAIILSAYKIDDFEIKELNTIDTLNDFISKPFKLKDLISKINANIIKIEKRANVRNTYKLLEQYKKALDNSAIISKTDTKGIITYANEKFCKISGYSKEELIGSNHNIVRSKNMPSKVFKELWETISNKEIWKGEIENQTKNKEPYFTSATILPILNSKNEIVEYMAIRFDITEHKLSLIKAYEAEKIKSRFLANMSHEIRTPINGIIGFLELLDETDLSNQQQDYVNIIKNSSSTLLSIINDILDFSKIEENQLDIESIDINLKKEIEPLTKIFALKAQQKGIDFIFDYDDNIPNHTGSKHKVKINGYIGNRQLDWNKPSPTITGRGSRSGGAVIHPHPNNKRRLSVRECARLQSFPDDFTFSGSNSAAFAHIGNAVPPILSFHLAKEFIRIVDNKDIDLNENDWNLPWFKTYKFVNG